LQAFPLRDSFFAKTQEAFLVVSITTRDAMRLFLSRIAVPIGYQMQEVADSGLAQEAFHAMIRPLKIDAKTLLRSVSSGASFASNAAAAKVESRDIPKVFPMIHQRPSGR
jgi:hypothetical protein